MQVAGKQVRFLTRGEVREIEKLPSAEQTDRVVELTLGRGTPIDDLEMPQYMELLTWAIENNGLDGSAIKSAKKN